MGRVGAEVAEKGGSKERGKVLGRKCPKKERKLGGA